MSLFSANKLFYTNTDYNDASNALINYNNLTGNSESLEHPLSKYARGLFFSPNYNKEFFDAINWANNLGQYNNQNNPLVNNVLINTFQEPPSNYTDISGLVAAYLQGDWDIVNNVWHDRSGSSTVYNAVLSATVGFQATSFLGNGSPINVTALKGGPTNSISFGNVLSNNYTVCSIARKTDTSSPDQIISDGVSWAHGSGVGDLLINGTVPTTPYIPAIPIFTLSNPINIAANTHYNNAPAHVNPTALGTTTGNRWNGLSVINDWSMVVTTDGRPKFVARWGEEWGTNVIMYIMDNYGWNDGAPGTLRFNWGKNTSGGSLSVTVKSPNVGSTPYDGDFSIAITFDSSLYQNATSLTSITSGVQNDNAPFKIYTKSNNVARGFTGNWEKPEFIAFTYNGLDLETFVNKPIKAPAHSRGSYGHAFGGEARIEQFDLYDDVWVPPPTTPVEITPDIPETNWVVTCETGETNDSALYVNGGDYYSGSNFEIAEMAVWDRKLTDDELQSVSNYMMYDVLGIQQSHPTMEWVWPADNSIVSDMNDYHPRFEDGTTTTGGYNGSMPLVNACTDADSPGGFMESTFLTASNYGVFGWHESNTVEMYDSPSYVDFIFTFTDPNTWCSGYRQFGQIEGGTNTFTKDIDIYTGDANFGPWTKVATDSHTTWHNDATNTFPDDGTTTTWTPTAPSKYLLIRTNSNHGDEVTGGRLTVRFLQLKLGI